ncbi:MAG: ATP-binding protein [Chloroflexota bacterium]
MADLPTGTITFLTCDIQGSTRMLHALGDEYSAVLEGYRRVVRGAVHARHGHEVSAEGDGFFLVFARAIDAVVAAIDIQRGLATSMPTVAGSVRARLSIHTGQPDLVDGDYVGLDLHRAARIGAAGHGGQVLVSRSTRELVESDLPADVRLRDLGEHWLKDLPRAEHLVQLVITGLNAEFPPLRTLEQRIHNLPDQLTTFIGREGELIEARPLMIQHRLLTLTGPGGTGKTRFALQLAINVLDRFADGVCFVPLAPIMDAHLVIPTLVQVLGLPDMQGRPPLEVLTDYLRGKHMLLLLDNFEQVQQAGPELVELLTLCPGPSILVTSRVALRVTGEHELPIPPLTLPPPQFTEVSTDVWLQQLATVESVRLFVERARAVRPDFTLTADNASSVAELCRQLDGLPLAVELAAARVRMLSPRSMLTRLGSGVSTIHAEGTGMADPIPDASRRLQFLTGGAVDRPNRQRTLRATIAWSYDLLSPQEQTLFRRLAIFVGGFTLETAEAAIGAPIGSQFWAPDPADALDGVESLLAKNLMRQMDGNFAEPRFTMLETIREYGLEQLAAEGELASLRRWHAEHFLQLSETVEPRLRGPEQVAWLDRLEAEHGNLRAALNFFFADERDVNARLRLAGALAWFWPQRGHITEGRGWLARALNASSANDGAERLKALYGAAWLAHIQRDGAVASTLLDTALLLARQLGNRWAESWVLHLRGRVAYFSGDAETAVILGRESLAIAELIGDRWLVGWAVHLLALAAHIAEDYEAARSYYLESISIRREIGYLEGEAICSHLLGLVDYRCGDYEASLPLVRNGVLQLQRLGAAWTIHNGLATWAALASALGQSARSVRLMSAIQSFSRVIDVSPIPLAESLISDTLTVLRHQLSAEDFDRYWAEGRSLSLNQAIEEAMLIELPAKSPQPAIASGAAQELSRREGEVLRLIARGRTSKEIADELVVSLATVERHLTHIYTKLSVRGRSEAVAWALRNGWVT